MQRELELLQQVTDAANRASDLEEAVTTALEGVAELTGCPVGHAYVRGWDHAELSPSGWWTQASSAFPRFREATAQATFQPDTGLPGRVAEQARPAAVTDIGHEDNFPRLAAARQDGLCSGFAFPVMSGTRVVAVLEFYSKRCGSPDHEFEELMGQIGVQLGRVFERLRWRSEIQEALEAKSRLLALLAHEVRTPVVAIEGFAGLLLDDLADLAEQDQRDYLSAIRQQAARLQRLTANTLRISRLEAGHHQAQRQPVDIDGFIDNVLRNLDLQEVDIRGANGLSVYVDRDHLEQIVTNYLTNAAAYGDLPVWIEIQTDPARGTEPPSVQLRVCDRGPGVPPSFVPELFRSFRRGTSGGSGSGLGLSIVRQLAELNGGAAWYEPLTPTGAAFAIRLPQSP